MKEIKSLLDKYFEGESTLDEEQMLRDYFRQTAIPEELEMYRPIFEFFHQERESQVPLAEKEKKIPSAHSKSLLRKISIGLAASILLVFGLRLALDKKQDPPFPPESTVYINGVKYIDEGTVNKEALHALENIAEENDELISSQLDILNTFNDL